MSHLQAGLGDGLRLILKCANGSLSTLGIPVLLRLVPLLELSFQVEVVNQDPFLRISTHPVLVDALVHSFYPGKSLAAEESGVGQVHVRRVALSRRVGWILDLRRHVPHDGCEAGRVGRRGGVDPGLQTRQRDLKSVWYRDGGCRCK